MKKKTLVLVAALLMALPLAVQAQVDEEDMAGDVVEVTATITAIDTANRLVTLEGEEGHQVTVYAGPAVKRFDELKVGDKVTFQYAEAVVVDIAEAAPGATPSATVAAAGARGSGDRPSGGVARQVSATVKVKALDPDEPSITVVMPDGSTETLEVDDADDLADIKVGDMVSLTYTQALLISVE
jgi:Cu/Ag efflux protein CusF